MKLVVVESPYAGDIERNERYGRRAMHDCLMRGEAPYASHLLYTQPGVLEDTDTAQRKLGMEAGFNWGAKAEKAVVYTDYGLTRGMIEGIRRHEANGLIIEYREIGFNED